VRRVYVPKGDGTTTRAIGVPTFEDKVLQRAVAMVLEAVYEQDFLECSYGFRPRRSAPQALQALWQALMQRGGGGVGEVDSQQCFDTVDHRQVRRFLDQRVRAGVIRRPLDKWLKAGGLEGTTLSHPEHGTPQGSGISPLLANLYLHEVLERWWEATVKPRLKGRASLMRYADDAVRGLACEADARRVLAVLPKRVGKYGLTLHPDKTRLLRFAPPLRRATEAEPREGDTARSFDFLGLPHYGEKSRKGSWVVKRKTAAGRFGRTRKRIAQWCRLNRHHPVEGQHQHLKQQLRGQDAYYGSTGKGPALRRLR
jgi:RNA-directed DNA polymerase